MCFLVLSASDDATGTSAGRKLAAPAPLSNNSAAKNDGNQKETEGKEPAGTGLW